MTLSVNSLKIYNSTQPQCSDPDLPRAEFAIFGLCFCALCSIFRPSSTIFPLPVQMRAVGATLVAIPPLRTQLLSLCYLYPSNTLRTFLCHTCRLKALTLHSFYLIHLLYYLFQCAHFHISTTNCTCYRKIPINLFV